jgi:hypothetical protein
MGGGVVVGKGRVRNYDDTTERMIRARFLNMLRVVVVLVETNRLVDVSILVHAKMLVHSSILVHANLLADKVC